MSVSAISASDGVSAVLGAALDGLSMRQRVIADNIANVDTPGFRATSVDFESSLRSAIASGDASDVGVATAVTDTPVGPDGNSVDLRKETVAAMQSQFQYQMMTRAVSDRFDIMRISAGA